MAGHGISESGRRSVQKGMFAPLAVDLDDDERGEREERKTPARVKKGS